MKIMKNSNAKNARPTLQMNLTKLSELFGSWNALLYMISLK